MSFSVTGPAVLPAEAQLGDRIKDRVKRDAERRIEERAVAAARRTLDLAEDAIVCAVTDNACIDDARSQGQEPVIVDADGTPVSGYEPASSSASNSGASSGGDDEPGEGVWANYDFVPGDRVLFFHDFEGTRVGNFPSRLDYLAGNLDVVQLGTGDAANRMLRVGEGTSESGSGGNGCFTIPLAETLPERFTLEFRMRTSDPLRRATIQLFSDASDDTPDTRCTYPPNPHIFVNRHEQGLQLPGGYGAPKAAGNGGFQQDEWISIALGCDGPYCKMYANGERVANVPRYEFPRAEKLHVFMNVYRYSVFVDDIRIAEGGARSLYDDLMAEGFFVTTGILFDFGSARLMPESTPTLEEIRAMLDDHPDVKIRIEGHTDDVGSDASNQQLSEERAASVKQYLVDHGIEASRLESVGLGESRPRSDNSTSEGQAMNRRVEVHLVQ